MDNRLAQTSRKNATMKRRNPRIDSFSMLHGLVTSLAESCASCRRKNTTSCETCTLNGVVPVLSRVNTRIQAESEHPIMFEKAKSEIQQLSKLIQMVCTRGFSLKEARIPSVKRAKITAIIKSFMRGGYVVKNGQGRYYLTELAIRYYATHSHVNNSPESERTTA